MRHEFDHDPLPPLTHSMSAADFAAWGTPGLAFVKRVVVDNETSWSIHAADGTNIGLAPNREVAMAAIIQHELEPASVH
ncbi:DUF1150 family protein [Magnetospirillum sp. 64-120]|uniref:DUF1150 family protein n=1 Tax=Magnetospirillum sp. 64-120 TaxID=1895778 RepID=UPI00092A1163|nr:DUF1150 family protein [Magnetospirillum sp. 64-120]OJX81790.1 MAG: hypothetical protein BGO92_15765 [Magnetospirillum sp. 64-120]